MKILGCFAGKDIRLSLETCRRVYVANATTGAGYMDEACAQKDVWARSSAMNVAVTKIYTAGSRIILF